MDLEKKVYCEVCGQKQPYEIKEDKGSWHSVKGEEFFIHQKQVTCQACQNEVFHVEIETENQNKLFDLYRKKYNIISPERIKEIREYYQLTQQDFSLLLGFPVKMITHYERGSLPSKEQSEHIREAAIPAVMAMLLDQNGSRISTGMQEILRAKLETSVGGFSDELKELYRTTKLYVSEELQVAAIHTASKGFSEYLRKEGFQLVSETEWSWYLEISIEHLFQLERNLKKRMQKQQLINERKKHTPNPLLDPLLNAYVQFA